MKVLSIAGFDPSSGAGITADIKTIAAHGCYGVTCITAYTVQSTQGVKRVEPVAAELVAETLEELVGDMDIAAVRIGMLGAAEVAGAVAEFLSAWRLPNVVLDPIVRASSGASLVGPNGLEVVRERLIPLSTVITPNIEEAAMLTGLPVKSVPQMEEAAARLRGMGGANVVVTGGHLEEEAVDVLMTESGIQHFVAGHIKSRSTHGTGCAFATAIACNLANGKSVRESVVAAKQYVREAIENAYAVGKGIGPLNHLYRATG